ncbi:putative pectate lyase E [Colletotrichum shisoi]|uniref:Pectate lyase n=1 Tax=Colletotrichum shisoi TaxID=2078593 RepID=A0A5Q4BG05_9PEZI|nr:putative pectate lyase E [Colletotrichum shisoi]
MRLPHVSVVFVLLFAASTGTVYSSRKISQPKGNRPVLFPIPVSKGSVTYKSTKRIQGVFDGGLKTYGRGVACNSRREGADADAVFVLEDRAVLRNAIIGADQNEGVHCVLSCAIENVWWTAVCEDALTMKGDGDGTVLGGGARGARDKVIQHDGRGTVTIVGFTVVDFGKLYRACGNCIVTGRRIVFIRNVRAFRGEVLAGVNTNRGDVATIDATCATGVRDICTEFLDAPFGV